MAKIIGRTVDLGVARELIRGDPVAPQIWVPKVEFSFDDKVTKARVPSSLGRIEDEYQSHTIEKWAEGDIGAEVRSQSIGLFLYALTGSSSPSGPTDSLYTHEFGTIQNDNIHDSLTFTVVDSNTTDQYRLVMINTFELTQELEDILRFSSNFLGRTSKGSSASASYITEAKFTKKHLTFKLAATTADLAAASAISLKSFTMTFSKNVVPDNVLGSAEPEDFMNQQFSIDGNFSLNYEDETYKNYMRNNTVRALEAAWENTDYLIGASSYPALTIDLSQCDFFDWEPNYALDEIVTQTVTYKAQYDLGGNDNMVNKLELKNAKDVYA